MIQKKPISVKSEWIYTSNPPHVFLTRITVSLPLPYHFCLVILTKRTTKLRHHSCLPPTSNQLHHNSLIYRWADKFRPHCNIFIYIRHICIKPVLCSRMVSLFHHTSPWTHRCLQSSPTEHRNGRVFRRSVQTACCYWILNRVKSSSNWNSQTNASRLWVFSVLMWVQ